MTSATTPIGVLDYPEKGLPRFGGLTYIKIGGKVLDIAFISA